MGESVPASVKANIEVDLARFSGDIRREWEALRTHDGTLGFLLHFKFHAVY